VIEAVQLLGNPDGTGPIPEGVNFGVPRDENGVRTGLDGKYWVQTLEGPLVAQIGDWIITGVKGERYPCKPDVFTATYEAVED
jgi:hypothetical protein